MSWESLLAEPRLSETFHRFYYDSHVWKDTHWLGVPVQKLPLDLWIYQEILDETRPDVLVEMGTAKGGSAFFFASVFDLLGHGEVLTVDIIAPEGRPEHDRITYLIGSSTAPEIVDIVKEFVGGRERVMVVLDSDHSRDHVLAELRLYGNLVSPGCYLVAEDTNINGHPVYSDFGPGPMEAVTTFLEERDDFEIDRRREKFLLTFHPSGFLQKESA
jgi:cephalosporin hydroxylase